MAGPPNDSALEVTERHRRQSAAIPTQAKIEASTPPQAAARKSEEVMLTVRTYIAPSKIHGMGVFAAEPIAAGTLLWEQNSIIDIEITAEQLAALPPAARVVALAHSFVDEDGRMILSRDNAVFFNHSDNPNTLASRAGNTAARDIAADEELTEDYRAFGSGACRAFLDAREQRIGHIYRNMLDRDIPGIEEGMAGAPTCDTCGEPIDIVDGCACTGFPLGAMP